MDSTILLFLLQDGVTNGAIYALLALALVLVFAVTRVILVPQGEFVTYGALTLAVLDLGKVPGTVGLLVVFAALALAVEVWASRKRLSLKLAGRLALFYVLPPLVIAALTHGGWRRCSWGRCRRRCWPSRSWRPWAPTSTASPFSRCRKPPSWCC